MSVQTEADRKLDAAKSNINDAIDNIAEIVVSRLSGSDDFDSDYKSKLLKSFNELLEIRERLA